MKKKIVLLVLHILCVLGCLVCSVITHESLQTLYSIITILWGIIVGIDVANIVNRKE